MNKRPENPTPDAKQLREEGNKRLKDADASGIAPSLKEHRLREAVRQYRRSLECSSSPEDISSVEKNLAVVHGRIMQSQKEQLLSEPSLWRSERAHARQQRAEELKFSAKEAFAHAAKAMAWGKKANRDAAWMDGVAVSAMRGATQLAQMDGNVAVLLRSEREVQAAAGDVRLVMQGELTACLEGVLCAIWTGAALAPPEVAYVLSMRLARMHYNTAARARAAWSADEGTAASLHLARRHLAELHRPAQEAAACLPRCRELRPAAGADSDIEATVDWYGQRASEVAVLGEEVGFLEASLGSALAVAEGNRCLQGATQDHEELQVELVWQAIDCYHQAIVAAREVEVETEAIACSKLGAAYTNCLKMPARGAQWHKRAVELGLTTAPRVLDHVPWFQQARAALLAWQTRLDQNAADQKEKQDAPLRRALEKEFAAVKAASEAGTEELLAHVYGKHPPKSPAAKRVQVRTEGAEEEKVPHKTQLKNAMIHYHTDKNRAEVYGREWQILAEECYKYLAAAYEATKG